MANTFNLPDMAKMVTKHITQSIEEAVYAEIRPIADRIARQAAKRIAENLKGYATHQIDYSKGDTYHLEPTIVLTFNGEEIKL